MVTKKADKKPQVSENTQEQEFTEKVETDSNDTLTTSESVNTKNEYPYIIELYDVWGSTSKRAVRFGAKRFTDGKNVFLVNEKRNFKEPFPEDTEDFKNYTIDKIDGEIEELLSKLEKDKKSANPKVSKLETFKQVEVLKGFKRSLELQGKGSYMIIDSDSAGARPVFMFDRRGNYKLPVFKNIDVSLMYLPTESKLTEASDLIKENDDKNQKKVLNLATMGLFIILVILVGAGMFFAYKTATSDNDYIDALNNIAENQNRITNVLTDNIDMLQNITNPTLDESIKVEVENVK